MVICQTFTDSTGRPVISLVLYKIQFIIPKKEKV